MSDQHNAPASTAGAEGSTWGRHGPKPDLTPVLRALVLDELRGQRLTPSRQRRIEQFGRSMGLSRRQVEELLQQCSLEVSGQYGSPQPAKNPVMSLFHWLSNKLLATIGKPPPRGE